MHHGVEYRLDAVMCPSDATLGFLGKVMLIAHAGKVVDVSPAGGCSSHRLT